MELLTAAQMRAIEHDAIASGAVTGLELMERAGCGVVEAIFDTWPDLAEGVRRAVVLAGPGNNGGDGYVIARLLANRGWSVEVDFYGDPQDLPPDARINRDRWCGVGGSAFPVTPQPGEHDLRFADAPVDLWIDAVFGTGLARPLPKVIVDAFDHIHSRRTGQIGRVVAVDILSGLHADTGARLSACPLVADLTVTFHAMKRGHCMAAGPQASGKVVVKDIGL